LLTTWHMLHRVPFVQPQQCVVWNRVPE
jgi:hypothetical protein